MTPVLLKASAIWIAFLALAIINATIREKALAPFLGARIALPLSGITLALLIFLVTQLLIPQLGRLTTVQYLTIGGLWLLMTVAFEFAFGRYVIGDSWAVLLKSYDISSGNLWLLVLLVISVSPYLCARVRGLV